MMTQLNFSHLSFWRSGVIMTVFASYDHMEPSKPDVTYGAAV